LFGFLCHWLDLDLAFTIFLLPFLRRSWALALVQSSLIGSSNCPAAAAVFFRVRFFCFLQVALCASVEWLFLLLIWILSSLILLPPLFLVPALPRQVSCSPSGLANRLCWSVKSRFFSCSSSHQDDRPVEIYCGRLLSSSAFVGSSRTTRSCESEHVRLFFPFAS
jgi:hypothetical protein